MPRLGKALSAGLNAQMVAQALDHVLDATDHFHNIDPIMVFARSVFNLDDVGAGMRMRREESRHYMNGASGEGAGLTALMRARQILVNLGEHDNAADLYEIALTVFPRDVVEGQLARVSFGW